MKRQLFLLTVLFFSLVSTPIVVLAQSEDEELFSTARIVSHGRQKLEHLIDSANKCSPL